MTDKIYGFTPALQTAYSAVHAALRDKDEVKGYRNLSKVEKEEFLDKSSFKYAAAQFHRYFPAHYFKARYLLDNFIEQETLTGWVEHNPHFVLIDSGCGAGAASAAYIEKLCEVCQNKSQEFRVYCLAFDPDKYSIVLYNIFMKELLKGIKCPNLLIDFNTVHVGIPALTPLVQHLELKRTEWNIPRLPNALLLRMNIDRPLSKRYYEYKADQEFFKEHEIQTLEEKINYGDEEALSYEGLLQNANIDNLNIIAVTTKGYDGSGQNDNKYLLNERLKEFSDAVARICDKNEHAYRQIPVSSHAIKFINGKDTFWTANKEVPINFFATATFISNKSLTADLRWGKILSIKSLQLAWVRARRNLLYEALYDEVEIRLFEDQLELNLSNLSNRLANYVNNIFSSDQTIAFKTLKATGDKRPRGLSRLEEEILFSAIIQDVSIEYSARYPRSYAYQIKHNRNAQNEYLYSDWFDAYNKYVQEASEAAKKYSTTGAVIQTDIKKFYEKIIQTRLLDVTGHELYKYSDRIEWLLRSLIDRKHHEHDEGKGLSQGSIGSGFFANVYLSPLHRFFQDMDVEFFRYVDDMLIVVKDANEVDEIVKKLAEFIDNELGLSLNIDKTIIYYDIDKFIQEMNRNEELSTFHQQHQSLRNLLWYGDSAFRDSLRYAYLSDDKWWSYLTIYQKCLAELSIFVDLQTLSRRTRHNLFNEENIAKHINNKRPLSIPVLPDNLGEKGISNWAQNFIELNPEFYGELGVYRNGLYRLFMNTYKSVDLNNVDKKVASKLRFAINKLSFFGLRSIRKELLEIVVNAPWLLEVSYTFENMALNGLYTDLDRILDYYNTKKDTTAREYIMAMALKAVRYFPELSPKNMKRLFEYGMRSPSLIERIMSTETILIRRKDIPDEIISSYLDIIAELLNQELNPRLEKNYVLLLGRFLPATYNPTVATDDMLRNAKFIALNNRADSLFDEIEHPIIRRHYYSAFDTQDEYRYFG